MQLREYLRDSRSKQGCITRPCRPCRLICVYCYGPRDDGVLEQPGRRARGQRHRSGPEQHISSCTGHNWAAPTMLDVLVLQFSTVASRNESKVRRHHHDACSIPTTPPGHQLWSLLPFPPVASQWKSLWTLASASPSRVCPGLNTISEAQSPAEDAGAGVAGEKGSLHGLSQTNTRALFDKKIFLQLLSNHILTRFKIFASQIIDKLCN